MFKQLDSTRIISRLAARSKKEVLAELAAAVAAQLPGVSAEELTALLLEREGLGSTGVGDGIALPHGKIRGLPELVLWFGRSPEGIAFDTHDSKPAHLFFLLLAPEESSTAYLKALARLSRTLKTPQVRARLLGAADTDELAAIFREVL